jgi:hypothetical protein
MTQEIANPLKVLADLHFETWGHRPSQETWMSWSEMSGKEFAGELAYMLNQLAYHKDCGIVFKKED